MVSVLADASITDAVALLARNNIGALVVFDRRGSLVGILSERDVARSVTPGQAMEELRVQDLMTNDLTCATPSDEVVAVLRRMNDGRCRHIPVLAGDELVGIVSIGDLVKAQLGEYQGVIVTLETMLMGAAR